MNRITLFFVAVILGLFSVFSLYDEYMVLQSSWSKHVDILNKCRSDPEMARLLPHICVESHMIVEENPSIRTAFKNMIDRWKDLLFDLLAAVMNSWPIFIFFMVVVAMISIFGVQYVNYSAKYMIKRKKRTPYLENVYQNSRIIENVL